MVSTFPKPWMDNRVAIRHIHWKIGKQEERGARQMGLTPMHLVENVTSPAQKQQLKSQEQP